MSFSYIYLTSEEDFKNALPFTSEEAYSEHVENYPTTFPCILEFADYSSNDSGYCFHIEIIVDMSDFIYQNNNLYKIDKSEFICKDGSLYKLC